MQIIVDQAILTKSCSSISQNEYNIFNLLEETIKQFNNAAGLSAPQIGLLKSAFIIKYQDKFIRFANPKIITKHGLTKSTEGCLSLPNRQFIVDRSIKITQTDDINGDVSIENYLAIVYQHEFDHLLGKTLLQTGREIIDV